MRAPEAPLSPRTLHALRWTLPPSLIVTVTLIVTLTHQDAVKPGVGTLVLQGDSEAAIFGSNHFLRTPG